MTAEKETASMLPLPETVIRHHAQVLAGPMKEWRSRKHIPPVLLLTGLPGVGKRSMAWYLAQWILCERSGLQKPADDGQDSFFGGGPVAAPEPTGEPEPCGECASCRKALHGTWIDFTEIEAEESDSESNTSGALKIDQFRKLKASMGFGGHEGSHRIILIPNADRMTPQAANSVLKLLEEPPTGWVFLLTAADSSLLLPTIVSRCQTLRFKPFPQETLEELLRTAGADEKKIPIAASLAQGSWGKALAWSEAETWDRRKLVVDFLHDPKSNLNTLVDRVSAEPKEMDRMIDQLEGLTADLLRWSLSGAPPGSPENFRWQNSDARTTLIRHASDALRTGIPQSRSFWIARAERMARARAELLAPLNRKLLAQDLLLPWLES